MKNHCHSSTIFKVNSRREITKSTLERTEENADLNESTDLSKVQTTEDISNKEPLGRAIIHLSCGYLQVTSYTLPNPNNLSVHKPKNLA